MRVVGAVALRGVAVLAAPAGAVAVDACVEAMNALEIALDSHPDVDHDDVPPPPPPAMDDPSDPPPSIDSAFHLPGSTTRISASPRLQCSPPMSEQGSAPPNEPVGHAPPPYGLGAPDHAPDHDHDQVARPPPYVDLVPADNHSQ